MGACPEIRADPNRRFIKKVDLVIAPIVGGISGAAGALGRHPGRTLVPVKQSSRKSAL